MLVLSRKINEVIQIGDDITVTVVEIGNSQVRLGVSAPRQIPVSRPDSIAQTLSFRTCPEAHNMTVPDIRTGCNLAAATTKESGQ